MITAVWGKSGSGRSVIANEIGRYYARRGNITVVVDTDMTQPTLPPRLLKAPEQKKASLGTIFAAPQVRDAQSYLHLHHNGSKLFFAGLTKDDHYLSHEIGMRQYSQAASFISACQSAVDVIVLDLCGQRGDPFLAVALDSADRFLMVHTPDIKNLCWHIGVNPLLSKKMSERSRSILHIANAVQRHHDLAEYEKSAGIKFTAVLPYSQSIKEVDGQGNFASFSCDHPGRVWQRRFISDVEKVLESELNVIE